LVFVDECGSNIALTPIYARAPKGESATGRVPRNRGKNTTLIASLSLEGMGTAMILEGSTHGAAFEIDVEQLLAPSMHVGQIVVMDNLRVHKGERVRQAIEAQGCQVMFLTRLFARLVTNRRDLLQAQKLLATSRSQNV
jgi:hypothetical protein